MEKLKTGAYAAVLVLALVGLGISTQDCWIYLQSIKGQIQHIGN